MWVSNIIKTFQNEFLISYVNPHTKLNVYIVITSNKAKFARSRLYSIRYYMLNSSRSCRKKISFHFINMKQRKNVSSYQFKEHNNLPNASLNGIYGFTWMSFWFFGGKVAQQKREGTWFMKLNLHFLPLHRANVFIVLLWYILCKF